MYQALLRKIAEIDKQFGDSPQPPCSPDSLTNLRHRARKELGHDLPDQYVEFLAVTNGLDFNGLVVYASDRTPIENCPERTIEGFIQGNLGYRGFDLMKDFLIFADDGVVLFTYCISKTRYEVILIVGLTVLESFATFDELLVNAFEAHL